MIAGGPNLFGNEKRTGGDGDKRDLIQPPSEPDSKAVIDEAAMDLIYQAKHMWGILSHPEYADANDGFDALMTQDALSYLAQGETCVDEAYSDRNFRGAKVRDRDERRNRINRMAIPIGRTALGGFQSGYDAYEELRWHSAMPSRPSRPEPGIPIVEEETKPTGCWINGKWRAYATTDLGIGGKPDLFCPPGRQSQIPIIPEIRKRRPETEVWMSPNAL